MKKKGLAVLLAAVSCLAVPVTAMAEEAEQTITVNLTADPTYTVTIPSSVSMDQNGTAVDVVAEDVENLQEGQKISVTIAGTSYYRNQLVVEADREDVSAGKVRQLRYQIISDDGETDRDHRAGYGSGQRGGIFFRKRDQTVSDQNPFPQSSLREA